MGKNEPHTALSPQQVDRPKMACGSAQHEQVPKEMHVFTAIIQKEKDGAKRIAKPAAHQPIKRLHASGGLESHQKRLDSDNHGPAHHKITNGLQVIDLPHPTERQQDTGHGGQLDPQVPQGDGHAGLDSPQHCVSLLVTRFSGPAASPETYSLPW